MSPKMREVIYCCLFLITVAMGSTDTECVASTRGKLVCKFPYNINSTQSDFGVYFYPDDGGEEPLVDCAWARSQLHCIRQEGFECQPPVSETAEITIPIRYMSKIGSYRCVPDGYIHDNIKSCRLTDMRDNDYFSLCEAAAISKHQSSVKCDFSFKVESFTVLQKTTLVAFFTKSVCQNSPICDYKVIDNHDVFTIYLDLEKYPSDNYSCHPNSSSVQVDIKVCHADDDAHNEGLPVLVYAIVASLITVSIMAALSIVIRPRRMRKHKMGADKKLIESKPA